MIDFPFCITPTSQIKHELLRRLFQLAGKIRVFFGNAISAWFCAQESEHQSARAKVIVTLSMIIVVVILNFLLPHRDFANTNPPMCITESINFLLAYIFNHLSARLLNKTLCGPCG